MNPTLVTVQNMLLGYFLKAFRLNNENKKQAYPFVEKLNVNDKFSIRLFGLLGRKGLRIT
jgi:hypothetical protein